MTAVNKHSLTSRRQKDHLTKPYRGGGSTKNRRAMKVLERLTPAGQQSLRDLADAQALAPLQTPPAPGPRTTT